MQNAFESSFSGSQVSPGNLPRVHGKKVVSEFGYFSTFIKLPRVCGRSFLQAPAFNLHMCAK